MASHSRSLTQAGSNNFAYDQNGNMTSRTVGGVAWTYTYNVENQLTAVRKNNQLVSEYGYDGDGKRVWAKDYEGYLPENPKQTVYVGDYYEVQVEGYVQPIGGTPSQSCTQAYCAYFPLVSNTVTENISYYYADGQRIAMKNNGVVSYLYRDQLGSTSAIADVNGNLVSRTLYHPWGTTRHTQGTNPTDYAFTGQMQEGEVYYYGARWYDPQLGRFMQADTIIPHTQGTQAFDRYAYVNNNPPRYYDAEGEYACDVNGNCFVEGWSASYNRVQSGNTCAVNSCAIALSILQGTNITQEEMLPHFPLTQNRDIGVPAWQQALVVDWAFPKVGVDYTKLNKQGIILNLKTDKPVIVTFALPLEKDFSGQRWAGHSVTAIGYQANLNQIIFFNTATGMIELENDMVHNYGELVASNFPLSISSKYDFSNFTSLQRNHNFFVGPYDAVVMYLSGFSNYYPIQGSGSLAAYRRMTR